ncbi:hypothetical protein [Streptomyces sp. NPDC001502]|uniref:hypothetical protein n=1 Tax=Streptomyces sp. NPDC001502 TaxID=3364578 RepID=UPI003684D9C6
MTSGRLTELLYTAYIVATGLPYFAAAARQERAAVMSAAGFRPGDGHVIPARWMASGQPAQSGSGS